MYFVLQSKSNPEDFLKLDQDENVFTKSDLQCATLFTLELDRSGRLIPKPELPFTDGDWQVRNVEVNLK
jgi:hypothetical protein